MLIPEFMFGIAGDVEERCRKTVTQLKKGVLWDEAVACPMIDTAIESGLLVLNGPSPLLSGQNHFHIYVLLDEIFNAGFFEQSKAAIFTSCLQTPWGILSLISLKNQFWLIPVERHVRFLEATLGYWEMLSMEGPRYTNGLTTGDTLWSLASNVKYVLANLGVPQDVLRDPLPAGGLAALVSKHDLLRYNR